MASRTNPVDQAYADAGGFDVWVKTSIGRIAVYNMRREGRIA